MHTGRLLTILFALSLLVATGLSTAPVAAQNGPPITQSHFLRIQEEVTYPDGVGEIVALGFRDGLMVVFNTAPDGTLTVFRDRNPHLLDNIQPLLGEAQIGRQDGRCDIPEGIGPEFDLPAGATGRSAVFSWFGLRNDRSNHLLIGDSTVADNFGTPCDAALTNALFTIKDFFVNNFRPGNVSPPITFRADDQVLFVVDNSWQEDPTCGDLGVEEDSYIFRDRLVIRDAVSSDGEYIFERGRALPGTQRTFQRALAQNRVGAAGGECELSFFQPFSVDGGCLDYSFETAGTWYGKGPRRSTLFATEATQNACTFEQESIAAGAQQYLRNTSIQPHTQRVDGQFPIP